MKTSNYLLIFCLLLSFTASAQIEFSSQLIDDETKLNRNKTKKTIYSFTIKSSIPNDPALKNYKVKVKADEKKTTLSAKYFEIDFKEILLSELGTINKFYLTIAPDSVPDRAREIYLDLSIDGNNDPNIKAIKNKIDVPGILLKVSAIEKDTVIKKFNYLAYIGTNFDLVDGIKAKNLFFATNIYKHPVSKKKDEDANKDKYGFGFNFTLYGNRTLSTTENRGRKEYTYKVVPVPGEDSAFVHLQEGQETVTRVTDNLGAAFSPMFNLAHLGDEDRIIQLYYAPQIEFIWRRSMITTDFTEVNKSDSTRKTYFRGSNTIILSPPSSSRSFNYYDLNLGLLGFFLSHETENISLRFQMAGGYSFRYSNNRGSNYQGNSDLFSRQGNFFFGARAWLTEATSGLTLGAEISNRVFKNYEPFYNVTLSKAISLGNLGSIFKPVATR
jgi:hypothetical protein